MIAIDLCGTNPNWGEKLVKEMNAKLFIFKGGFSFNTSDKNRDDSQIWVNIKKAEKYKIPYGIYIYSYAKDKTAALLEAQHAIDIYNKSTYKPKLIFIDVEERDIAAEIGKTRMTAIVEAFCEEVEKKTNAVPGYYCDTNFYLNYIDIPIKNNRLRWLAQWSTKAPSMDYHIWQNQSVNGDYGDIDINYVPDNGRVASIIYPKEEEKPTPITPTSPKKNIEEVVKKTLDGEFGNGEKRKNAIEKIYGDWAYYVVQSRINSYIRLAERVKNGDYGNGNERADRLKKLGYDPQIVQTIINNSIK